MIRVAQSPPPYPYLLAPTEQGCKSSILEYSENDRLVNKVI